MSLKSTNDAAGCGVCGSEPNRAKPQCFPKAPNVAVHDSVPPPPSLRPIAKMPPTHISGTSRALYRVFILPTLRAPTSVPLQFAPAFAPLISQPSLSPSLTSRTSIRQKTYAKDTQRHALQDHYIFDGAIENGRINFVDEHGRYNPDIYLADALYKVNRTTHYLVQMTPQKFDEYGNLDRDDVPTCRVVSKIDLRAQHSKKMDLLRRQAKGQGAGPPQKNLELNWAIAGGDLKHRLGRLKEFLSEGRKVEVLLGPKKKGRKATEQEANDTMQAVRDAVTECKGAGELRSEGDVGGVLTIVFQGKKPKEKIMGAKDDESSRTEAAATP